MGGSWGLWEGLRRPEGRTARLRLNSILNGCTRRGPFLGNACAVLGKVLISDDMIYSIPFSVNLFSTTFSSNSL